MWYKRKNTGDRIQNTGDRIDGIGGIKNGDTEVSGPD